jgi:hypothetical protein
MFLTVLITLVAASYLAFGLYLHRQVFLDFKCTMTYVNLFVSFFVTVFFWPIFAVYSFVSNVKKSIKGKKE